MTLYKDKDAKVAAKAMLDEALKRAGKDDTWNRLGVARVLYLSGDKAAAQPIMDAVQAKETDPENLMRLGRIYVEAGEWTRAAPIFDKILTISPDDDDFTLEIAVFRLQNGDRSGAETILDKLFATSSADPDYLIKAAGGFLGVKP
jgi:Flp pilus assembly protein TadD